MDELDVWRIGTAAHQPARRLYRACVRLGISPITKEWDGNGSAIEFVVAKNLDRRHLDQGERAMIGAQIANMQRGDGCSQRHNIGKTGLSISQAGAEFVAAQRADQMIARGDPSGEAMWKRILVAIRELRKNRPPPGEARH